jgi:hypothetical protein
MPELMKVFKVKIVTTLRPFHKIRRYHIGTGHDTDIAVSRFINPLYHLKCDISVVP